MQFTFGMYIGLDIESIILIDRRYCIWLADNMKSKKKDKELYDFLTEKISLVIPEPEIENPNKIMFGKYKGYDIEEIVFSDQSYSKWLLKNGSFKIEFPKTYELFKKYYDEIYQEEINEIENPNKIMFGKKYEGYDLEEVVFSDQSYSKWLLENESFKSEYPETYELLKKYIGEIYQEQINEFVYFYILTFVNRDYVKVGITSNFIVKRIYNYTHTMNFYSKDIIDYNKSFVYETNDKKIEKIVLNHFKDLRLDKKTERINVILHEIDTFLTVLYSDKSNIFLNKKCLKDFIPFDFGNQFKESFYVKINEFQKFRTVYEEHLDRLDLLENYNPDFPIYAQGEDLEAIQKGLSEPYNKIAPEVKEIYKKNIPSTEEIREMLKSKATLKQILKYSRGEVKGFFRKKK